MANAQSHLFVGTYSSEAQEGIEWLAFHPDEGLLNRVGGVSGIANPSFLAVDPGRKLLFAVSETERGEVVSYRIDESEYALHELGRQPSHGHSPCHVVLDESGAYLLLVNYMSGDICVYPVAENGIIGPASERIRHEGSGPRADRQEAAHTHSIFPIPSTDLYLVSDLGTDTIHAYRLNRSSGRLAQTAVTRTQPGAGPRHLAFHPIKPMVYVLEELTSRVSVFSVDTRDGVLKPVQSISMLPEDFKDDNTGAEILISASGAYVYASNRGHDSIAVFKVGDDGMLTATGHATSGGKSPRNFILLPGGDFLITANQSSDNLAVLKLNAQGMPEPTGSSYDVNRPVCLKLWTVER